MGKVFGQGQKYMLRSLCRVMGKALSKFNEAHHKLEGHNHHRGADCND